jgi:hypothetical protein
MSEFEGLKNDAEQFLQHDEGGQQNQGGQDQGGQDQGGYGQDQGGGQQSGY